MQILVLYFSKGGNTKKLAEKIGQGVDKVEDVKAILRHAKSVLSRKIGLRQRWIFDLNSLTFVVFSS